MDYLLMYKFERAYNINSIAICNESYKILSNWFKSFQIHLNLFKFIKKKIILIKSQIWFFLLLPHFIECNGKVE